MQSYSNKQATKGRSPSSALGDAGFLTKAMGGVWTGYFGTLENAEGCGFFFQLCNTGALTFFLHFILQFREEQNLGYFLDFVPYESCRIFFFFSVVS